jgi:hypothetical protein
MAFERPEAARPMLFTQSLDDGPSSVEDVAPGEIPDEWLPAPGFSLDLPTLTVAPAESLDDLAKRVRQERRARLRIRLELPELARTEAPTRRVGELLVTTQNLLDNLGSVDLDPIPAQRGPLPARITDSTASSLTDLRAASFVLELASGDYDDLFDSSVFGRISDQLVGLLGSGSDKARLTRELSEMRPRAAKSFRSFVYSLAKFHGDVTVASAGSDRGIRNQRLTAEEVEGLRTLLEIVAPDENYEIRGSLRLYRVDIQRKHFGLQSVDGQRYEGRIAERAVTSVDHAEINQVYDATITEYTSFDEMIGEPRSKYILEQLVAIDSDEPGIAERVPIASEGSS